LSNAAWVTVGHTMWVTVCECRYVDDGALTYTLLLQLNSEIGKLSHTCLRAVSRRHEAAFGVFTAAEGGWRLTARRPMCDNLPISELSCNTSVNANAQSSIYRQPHIVTHTPQVTQRCTSISLSAHFAEATRATCSLDAQTQYTI